MRKRSSTSAMTSCDSMPHLEMSRSFETERIASHKITLSFLVPPSPFLTFTCRGMSRWVDVSGKTTTRSAGPALKKSTESTSTLVCGPSAHGHGSGEDRQARSRRGVDKPYGLKYRRLTSRPIAAAPRARLSMLFCSAGVLHKRG